MAPFTIYRLRFRSPLRIGERGVGLEVTRPYVPADTLFSAVCSAWRELYGVRALTEELLQIDDNGAKAPFLLSSAFPFAGAVRFFPKPLAHAPNQLVIPDDQGKDFKRVQFVSQAIFAKLIAAAAVTFDKNHCGNGGTVWIDPAEKAALAHFAAEPENYEFWRINVRPRVTLDRLTSASQIWHIGSVHFKEAVIENGVSKEGAGLWFAAAFAANSAANLQTKLDACLRLLGDTGLGGERGGGYGLFAFTQQDDPATSLPSAANASAFVTLAPCCPNDKDELQRLTAEQPAYEIITRRGWIGSTEGSTLRRQTVWMFREGSVLSGAASSRYGKLVELTPAMWRSSDVPDEVKHRVFRYGYAFPIGFHHEVPS
jgi:CRISPR-associated protein Csm4